VHGLTIENLKSEVWKGFDEAKERGWTVINMEKEWKVIYPFELKKN